MTPKTLAFHWYSFSGQLLFGHDLQKRLYRMSCLGTLIASRDSLLTSSFGSKVPGAELLLAVMRATGSGSTNSEKGLDCRSLPEKSRIFKRPVWPFRFSNRMLLQKAVMLHSGNFEALAIGRGMDQFGLPMVSTGPAAQTPSRPQLRSPEFSQLRPLLGWG